jgi:hypothetical protein
MEIIIKYKNIFAALKCLKILYLNLFKKENKKLELILISIIKNCKIFQLFNYNKSKQQKQMPKSLLK